ncbi:alpha-ribazole phosphatase [Aquimarina rhabdastrellae]
MDIYLIRHTTPDIEKGICYGQSDIGVTADFKHEIAILKSHLPLSTIDKVYSSPLKRCTLLAQDLKTPVIQDNRLKELNFGSWELQAWDSIPKSELDPWMKNFVTYPVPNGESYISLHKRVMEFFNELKSSTAKNIIVVSHAGPIRALLASLQQIDLKDSFSIPVAYGQISKISIDQQQLDIISPFTSQNKH